MNEMKKYDQKENRGTTIEEPAVAYSAKTAEMCAVSLCIPPDDLVYLEDLAKLKGWTIKAKGDLLEDFLSSRPKHVDMSEEEIVDEVKAVRYGNENNS